MRNIFFGSLIPLLFLTIHSIKHNNVFIFLYFVVYCLHLHGRPFYNISVLQLYHIHRLFECMLMININIFFKLLLIIILYFFLKAKVCLSPLYVFFMFLALKTYDTYVLYSLNIITTIALSICVMLFDLPVHRNSVNTYFYIRMLKNYILALLLWLNCNMNLMSLPIIIISNFIYYYLVDEDDPIEKEYFINEIPIVYPIPLDIKDAIKYCKTAKTLFKKQAI